MSKNRLDLHWQSQCVAFHIFHIFYIFVVEQTLCETDDQRSERKDAYVSVNRQE